MGYLQAQSEGQSHSERWSEDKVQQAIRVWDLNDEEEQQLRLLRKELADPEMDHFKNTPHEVVRYMKGPKGPSKAQEMFRGMIQWRKNSEENIDTMLDDYKPPRALYEYAASGLLQGVDNDGDPIYLERAGKMDGFGLVQRYEPDELLKSVVWRRELTASGAWIDDYEKEHGHLPRQLNVIYDLEGLNSRHMKKGVGAFFKEAVAYTQDKYYGVSKRMIIIRPPTIFRMVWRIVQNFFQPEVRAKIVFADKDYLKTLSQYMDINVLPPSVYPQGTGAAARGFPPQFDGGLVPADFVDRDYNISNDGDDCSTAGRTLQTCRSRDSASLSSDDDDEPSLSSSSAKYNNTRRNRVAVFSRSLLQGSLMLSKCGTEFELDIESVQSVTNLHESFC